ncbi:hypothetical protein EV702DRAFT_1202350 [Suillus placidus]|uniref:Uncharacterized protein n=1 Tax=Suillus placidus TaxID=48579 RepID=A0A9P6ZKU4_9AGAM|nr:hypothetical protein EV702DRAFT_1202350 [Suillus placidus]
MCNTSKAVSPFYDHGPSAPPPFPSMLTDQLELFVNNLRLTTLIADEILAPKASSIVSDLLKAPPALAPVFKLAKRSCKLPDHFVSSPYSKKVARIHSCCSLIPVLSVSPGCSNSSSDRERTWAPQAWGYMLYDALNWSPKAYARFKKFTHHLIDDHLETTKCASTQSDVLLKVVRIKAVCEFPELGKYDNLWPVNDIIMSRLKYTSGHARRKLVEMAAGKMKMAFTQD